MQHLRRIGVIGLGRMGSGLVRNLVEGFDVTGFDLDEGARRRCAELGARTVDRLDAAVADADLVVTSLPAPADVLAAVDQMMPILGADAVVMDTSTTDPETATQLALRVGRDRFVACLLGKGPAQAEAGELPLFIGGDDDVIASLETVLGRIGDRVHRLGTVEAATAFKLASNLIGMSNLAVLAEGYVVCRRAGVDDDAFAAALADTGGWSAQAALRLPWMAQGDFAPRFSVDLGLKDLTLAVSTAARSRVPTPVGAASLSQLVAASARGHGAADVAAVLDVVDPA